MFNYLQFAFYHMVPSIEFAFCIWMVPLVGSNIAWSSLTHDSLLHLVLCDVVIIKVWLYNGASVWLALCMLQQLVDRFCQCSFSIYQDCQLFMVRGLFCVFGTWVFLLQLGVWNCWHVLDINCYNVAGLNLQFMVHFRCYGLRFLGETLQ